MADLTMADVRAKFPQYNDMSDEQLAQGLHQKYYSDLPFDQFSAKIGYKAAPPAEPDLVSKLGQHLDSAVKGSALYGAADTIGSGALNLGGKAASGLHGLGLLLGHALGLTNATPDAAADTVNADRAALHTDANSPGAQQVGAAAGEVAKPFQAVAAPIDKAIANAGPGVSTFVPAASEAVQDIAGLVPGAALPRAVKAADAATLVEGAAKPTVGNALETVRGAGYKVLPSDAEARLNGKPSVGAKTVEGLGGADLRRDIRLHNAAKTNELAAQDMAIPNKPKLTPEDYDAARVPHSETYKSTGKAFDMSKPTADVITDLDNIAGDQTPKGMVQPKIRTQIARVQNAMNSGNYTGTQLVKDVSYFRQAGAKSVADALESEMERQLGAQGKGPELAQFRAARTGFAKIQNYQDATTGGLVDAQDFKRLTEKSPHLLTGNAKVIAQAGAEIPDLTKLPAAVKTSGLDRVLGISKVATVVPKVAEVVAGKVGASDFFQKRFGRQMTDTEKSYVPSFGRKPEGPSKAFELTNAPGRVGDITPEQIGMEVAQGRPAAPGIELMPPEGNVGVQPVQLGMEVSQGRPYDEQHLGLQPTKGNYDPYQHELLPPENRKPKPKGKKSGKD